MYLKSLLFFLLIALQPLLAFETLSADNKASFERDGIVLVTENIKGLSWPKITAFLKVQAPPKEAMALFAAYDDQKNYVPNVVISKPVKEHSPLSVDIEYELNLPWPIPNSRYTHGHKISKELEEEIYQINWWMIKSTSAEKVEGLAKFSPLGEFSLLKYESLVVPKSSFAGLLKKTMLKDVEKTLLEIRQYIELNQQIKSQKMLNYVQVLEQTLSGKSHWKNLIE